MTTIEKGLVKFADFVLSFFISPDKRAAIDWNKPIPMWQSITIWIIWLGIFFYSWINFFIEIL